MLENQKTAQIAVTWSSENDSGNIFQHDNNKTTKISFAYEAAPKCAQTKQFQSDLTERRND